MVLSVICHSCGSRIELAEDFMRRRRCPECGVMCEVTEAAKSSTPWRPQASAGACSPGRGRTGPPALEYTGPGTDEAGESAAETRSQGQSRGAGRRCRSAARRPAPFLRRHLDRGGRGQQRLRRLGRAADHLSAVSQGVAAGDGPCVGCGRELKSGKKKAALQYQPFHATGSRGCPTRAGSTSTSTAVGVSLLLSIGAVIFVGPWYVSFGPWLGFVVMLAFLLGTFNRVDRPATAAATPA